MRRKQQVRPACETCGNLIPIGEGDHICYECKGEPVMVISEYTPTEEYLACKGKRYEPN